MEYIFHIFFIDNYSREWTKSIETQTYLISSMEESLNYIVYFSKEISRELLFWTNEKFRAESLSQRMNALELDIFNGTHLDHIFSFNQRRKCHIDRWCMKATYLRWNQVSQKANSIQVLDHWWRMASNRFCFDQSL